MVGTFPETNDTRNVTSFLLYQFELHQHSQVVKAHAFVNWTHTSESTILEAV
jgi:hypothetical protein